MGARKSSRGDGVGSGPGTARCGLGLLIFVGSLLAAGCVNTIDGQRGVPPVFEYEPLPPDETHWTVSPLVGFDLEKDSRSLHVLWPIFNSTREGQNYRAWLFLLFYWNTLVHSGGEVDKDRALYPFFFWGSDPQEGGYFMLLPFFGNVKGKLGGLLAR